MDRFLFLTFDGLARGAVLAAFALSLVLIWRAARIVNFAQGAMAVAATYIAFTVTALTGSYWAGLAAALLAGFLIGALVERGVMRFVGNGSALNPVIAGLGLLMLIQAILGMVFGNSYRTMVTPFSSNPVEIFGITVFSSYDLFVFACIALLVGGLVLLFTKTPLGLRLRASAFAPDLARLLGVRTSRMLTLGWAMSSALGALAALLVIPTELGLNPHAADTVFVYAFTVAVIGGLDSPAGAVLGGLAVGVLLSWVSGYGGATLAPIAILVLLLAVLLVRPGGIFSMTKERTV